MPTRVPQPDGEFNTYITNSTTYLLAGSSPVNYERLLLTTTEKDDWVDFRDQWVAIYALTSDPSTATKANREQKENIKRDFIAFSSLLLTRMSTSPDINTTDRNTLNLKERDSERTARGIIDAVPNAILTSMPGGRVKLACRTTADASRASMHELADGIEMRVKIGAPAPASVEECPIVFTHSAATFNYEAGPTNAGQRLYAYFRYFNRYNAANNGPWSTAYNIIIEG